MYEIQLAKEPFKFSCSHFTILTETKAERLHGHNYQVRVDIAVADIDPRFGMAFDYNAVKPLIRKFCDRLDERILVPTKSPFLEIDDREGEIEVRFQDKRYVFPADDVIRLPLANVTCEELARYAGERLRIEIGHLPHWTGLSVSVEETRGQSVRYTIQR